MGFNNAIVSRGKTVGFRCAQCRGVVDAMWGDICNTCRETERRHKELVAATQSAKSEPQEFSIHQLAEIRSAILTVVDDGCDCESGEKHPWEFYEDGTEGGDVDAYTEDMANANRLRFVNAVQSRLTATLKGNRG